MDGYIVSNDAIMVNNHARVYDHLVTNDNIVADVNTGKNFNLIACLHIIADVCEGTNVDTCSQAGTGANVAGLLNSLQSSRCHFLVFGQQSSKSTISIRNSYQCCIYFLLKRKLIIQ